MPMITYDEATMGTGFPDIDAQHRELIDRLNQLLEGMRAGHGQDELLPILDFLADYTVRHFRHEEGCMARNRCAVAAANKTAHDRFLLTVAEFRRRLQENGPSVTLVIDAQRQLADWVRNHIVRTDTHLRSCAFAAAGRDAG